MVRRLIAGAVVTGLAVGVAVTSASAAFTNKKACKIITESDVEEFFGAAPTQTIQDGQKGKFTTCTWKVPNAGGVETTAFIGIDKPSKVSLKDFDENRKSPTAEKVPGIKKGFIDGITVTFIRNGNFVNVQHLGPTPADTNTAALIELAKELYGKL
jgi:hypothetical protein